MPVARGVKLAISEPTKERIRNIKSDILNAINYAQDLCDLEQTNIGGVVPHEEVKRYVELISNLLMSAQDKLAIPLHEYDRFLLEAGGKSRDEVSSYWRSAQRALEGASGNLDAQDWRLVRASLRGAWRAMRAVGRIGRVRP